MGNWLNPRCQVRTDSIADSSFQNPKLHSRNQTGKQLTFSVTLYLYKNQMKPKKNGALLPYVGWIDVMSFGRLVNHNEWPSWTYLRKRIVDYTNSSRDPIVGEIATQTPMPHTSSKDFHISKTISLVLFLSSLYSFSCVHTGYRLFSGGGLKHRSMYRKSVYFGSVKKRKQKTVPETKIRDE